MSHIYLENVCIDFPILDSKSRSLRTGLIKKIIGGRLSKSKGTINVRALDNINLSLKDGDRVGLIGHNGAGKTTSFYMTMGLLAPDSGQIFLSGNEVTTLPLYKRARLGISYLPQNTSIFKKLTVKDNLLAVMQIISILEVDEALKRRKSLL